MTRAVRSQRVTIDLEDLGLDRGGHLLIERALGGLPIGGRVQVRGRDAALPVHLRAWARQHGHGFELVDETLVVARGEAERDRWRAAERAGGAAPTDVVARPGPTWGVAARGALVE